MLKLFVLFDSFVLCYVYCKELGLKIQNERMQSESSMLKDYLLKAAEEAETV